VKCEISNHEKIQINIKGQEVIVVPEAESSVQNQWKISVLFMEKVCQGIPSLAIASISNRII
jgi:hypothetical protein